MAVIKLEEYGKMTCEFTSFSTAFQSYQDDGWMKGCLPLR